MGSVPQIREHVLTGGIADFIVAMQAFRDFHSAQFFAWEDFKLVPVGIDPGNTDTMPAELKHYGQPARTIYREERPLGGSHWQIALNGVDAVTLKVVGREIAGRVLVHSAPYGLEAPWAQYEELWATLIGYLDSLFGSPAEASHKPGDSISDARIKASVVWHKTKQTGKGYTALCELVRVDPKTFREYREKGEFLTAEQLLEQTGTDWCKLWEHYIGA